MSIFDIFKTRKKEKAVEVREEQRKILDGFKSVELTVEDEDKPDSIKHAGRLIRLDGGRPFLPELGDDAPQGFTEEGILNEPGLCLRVQAHQAVNSMVVALAYAHRHDREFIRALGESGLQIVWEK